MAFSGATSWEVRTTGSDANGGGFVFGATGTDFSQQNSPQFSYTDIVIGATTTQGTSVGRPFSSVDVGNVINMTAGTGFVVQRVQIVSVSGVTATFDKTLGTAASTGGTGALGGGLLTVGRAVSLFVNGNVAWVQTGTYVITANIAPAATASVIGYGTTHGDNAALATISTATNVVHIFDPASNIAVFTVGNIAFATTGGATSTIALASASSTIGYNLFNCTFTGFSVGINGSNVTNLHAYSCLFSSCAIGIDVGNSNCDFDTCTFQSCSSQAINMVGTNPTVSLESCLIVSSGEAILFSSNRAVVKINNCTIASITGNGIFLDSNWPPTVSPGNFLSVKSCILYGITGTAISAPSSWPWQSFIQDNAIGNNGTNYTNITSQNDVTLTANPFTSSGTGDFSLNSTAGGGAACKGVGFPGTFPGGTTVGHIDIGAVQSAAGGGGSTGGSYAYVG